MNAKYTLSAHIAELVAAGYGVYFGAHDGQAEAFIVKDDDTALAHGETHAEALWTCSPLHGDDEPYPGEDTAPGAIDSHSWRCAGCGGQCIGTEPDTRLCRGCDGR